MIVRPTATTTPANQPSMLAPGLIAAAKATSPPLSTIEAPPSVSTLSGSARRLSVGHTSALSSAAMTAVTSAPAGPWTSKSGSSAPSSEQGGPVQKQDHQAADGESPEPGHGDSLARVRVIQPHPSEGDDASPQRSLASVRPRRGGRTMDDVTQIAKEWWLFAVLGVVSLVCGVLAIVYPDVTLLAVGIIFGFYLLMAGVFELVEAIVGDPASRALSAIVGIVALIAGLICLRRPGDSLLALVVVLGAYLIVTGVARLVRAFASVEHRGLSLLSAVVDLILGILILSWPDESLVTLAVFFGISLIFRGVFALVAAFQLRKLRNDDGADVAPPITAAPA